MHPNTAERPKSPAGSLVDRDLPLVTASRNGDVSAFEEFG